MQHIQTTIKNVKNDAILLALYLSMKLRKAISGKRALQADLEMNTYIWVKSLCLGS